MTIENSAMATLLTAVMSCLCDVTRGVIHKLERERCYLVMGKWDGNGWLCRSFFCLSGWLWTIHTRDSLSMSTKHWVNTGCSAVLFTYISSLWLTLTLCSSYLVSSVISTFLVVSVFQKETLNKYSISTDLHTSLEMAE